MSSEEVKEEVPVGISLCEKGDIPLIYATWLESYREAKSVSCIRKNVYFSYLRLKIDETLAKPNVFCVKAHLKEDSDCIFAWAVFEKRPEIKALCLHYVFTKFKYRHLGIAKKLINSIKKSQPFEINYYTHRNNADKYLFTIPWLEAKLQMTYNPFLF